VAVTDESGAPNAAQSQLRVIEGDFRPCSFEIYKQTIYPFHKKCQLGPVHGQQFDFYHEPYPRKGIVKRRGRGLSAEKMWAGGGTSQTAGTLCEMVPVKLLLIINHEHKPEKYFGGFI
jgi:hypothetical protein